MNAGMPAPVTAADESALSSIAARVATRDWTAIAARLETHGWARIHGLLSGPESESVAALYPEAVTSAPASR